MWTEWYSPLSRSSIDPMTTDRVSRQHIGLPYRGNGHPGRSATPSGTRDCGCPGRTALRSSISPRTYRPTFPEFSKRVVPVKHSDGAADFRESRKRAPDEVEPTSQHVSLVEFRDGLGVGTEILDDEVFVKDGQSRDLRLHLLLVLIDHRKTWAIDFCRISVRPIRAFYGRPSVKRPSTSPQRMRHKCRGRPVETHQRETPVAMDLFRGVKLAERWLER